MKIVPQSVEILTPIDGDKALQFITEVGYVSHGTKKKKFQLKPLKNS